MDMCMNNPDIIIENSLFRLVAGSDCLAKSLILKATGEECLMQGAEIPLFSVTQDRPFNNEVKLAHPTKRTTFQANRLRREGNRLIVGFEIIPYEAAITISEQPMYVAFELSKFLVPPGSYGDLRMALPPACELRLLQLPIKDRSHFGHWLNVSWDESAVINVLATSPHARIEAERRKGFHIMTADAVRGIKLQGCGAALIASPLNQFLDAIDAVEEDFGLPRGVKSRRSGNLNTSIYWGYEINPTNVDEHIAYARQAGFRMMLLYYPSVFTRYGSFGYGSTGDYHFRKEYQNGAADLAVMLQKIKDAGITPGLHVLHTFVGLETPYVTPVADHRLHLTRRFSLARPLDTEDTEIYVEQNPDGAVLADGCRLLQFDGEIISYTGYTIEYPYKFTGCFRGACKTNITPHARGLSGGILDVCEFVATSVYIDQETNLQDEIADKIAEAYNAGFEFIYFDGAEGTNAPYEYHVPNAQYRVYKKLNPPPLFAEGAAKAHFSWHMLSGGNAFDVWKRDEFKKKTNEHPMEEASRMQDDFTRVNFGWWRFYTDGGPDIYEYGTSRAAGWDCPVTMQAYTQDFKANPRCDDILEVIRRWEDVRHQNLLTPEQKAQLRRTDTEHTLLINETGAYELVPYYPIPDAAGNSGLVAFHFERAGKNYVTFWLNGRDGTLTLPLRAADIRLERDIGKEALPAEDADDQVKVTAGNKCYLSSTLPMEQLITAFQAGTIQEN